jgi:hypothetical protein
MITKYFFVYVIESCLNILSVIVTLYAKLLYIWSKTNIFTPKSLFFLPKDVENG